MAICQTPPLGFHTWSTRVILQDRVRVTAGVPEGGSHFGNPQLMSIFIASRPHRCEHCLARGALSRRAHLFPKTGGTPARRNRRLQCGGPFPACSESASRAALAPASPAARVGNAPQSPEVEIKHRCGPGRGASHTWGIRRSLVAGRSASPVVDMMPPSTNVPGGTVSTGANGGGRWGLGAAQRLHSLVVSQRGGNGTSGSQYVAEKNAEDVRTDV